MGSPFCSNLISENKSSPSSSCFHCFCFLTTFLVLFPLLLLSKPAQASICRTFCGSIPVKYPFGIDDGCGSPYYRHMLICSDYGKLELRTPSGRYPVSGISYSDPHILLNDPFMWKCQDGDNFRATRPFSLDTSTHFSLSSQNDYLFFNCSEENVIIEPKPIFCERFPERCDSSCDSSSYLCRHLPECPSALHASSCCGYYPKATESLRLMLKYCASYTSIYWKNVGTPPYDQVAEYGIRVDFDIPVTTSCLQCQDMTKGGGTCGFNTETQNFLCLCPKGNSTAYCKDHEISRHSKAGVIAGTVTGVSAAGVIGIGAAVWYLRKVRATAPVTCGVQSNENRLF
ncbi:Wall-associated receptor kinase-like [Melia azedarach]|uniref:Wall-associated receptor kinase-like n=2 Tax=Melia azedarach TaxID=155640 RepID=A0ACC1WXI9_MELAZ|nr:Wall-associated receptor kinase-like [Melia azedarach]KAJ4703955.1 Wall-associated receptor kinase-like [Melia azedarach]